MKHHLSNAIAKTQIKSNFQNYHQQNQTKNQKQKKQKQKEFEDQQQQHRTISLIHINNLLEQNFWFNFQVITIIIIMIVSTSSGQQFNNLMSF